MTTLKDFRAMIGQGFVQAPMPTAATTSLPTQSSAESMKVAQLMANCQQPPEFKSTPSFAPGHTAFEMPAASNEIRGEDGGIISASLRLRE